MTVLKFPPRRSPEPDDDPACAGPGPDAPGADAPAESGTPQPSPRARFAWIGTALSVLIFGVSLAVLWHLGSQMDPAEVRTAFTTATAQQLGLAVLFTAVSYLLLTGYDALALRQLQIRTIPLRTTALASFTSYAVSFNLGFPLLTAGTVRYWIYAPRGLSAGKVASLTVVAGLTFLLGMATVLGFSLLRHADEIAVLTYTSRSLSQLVGLVAALVVAGYLVWVSIKHRAVRLLGRRLELPGFRLSLAQMIIGAGDVCAAAGVLYVLLPAGHGIDYGTFLGLYVFAALLGVASHAPGGLGVFEATILLALPSLPREQVLGALLLFRICYYLLPFLLALAALGAYEILNRLKSARAAMRPEDE